MAFCFTKLTKGGTFVFRKAANWRSIFDLDIYGPKKKRVLFCIFNYCLLYFLGSLKFIRAYFFLNFLFKIQTFIRMIFFLFYPIYIKIGLFILNIRDCQNWIRSSSKINNMTAGGANTNNWWPRSLRFGLDKRLCGRDAYVIGAVLPNNYYTLARWFKERSFKFKIFIFQKK